MKKLMIAIAGAVALGCSAFAEPTAWFDGGIEEGWPTNAVDGVWSNTNGTTFAEEKLTVASPTNAPLTFTANASKTFGKDATEITYTSTIEFTPFATDEIPDVPEGAKGGVIAVGTQDSAVYYVLGQGEGGKQDWLATTIPATFDEPVDVTIKFYGDPSACAAVYTIGGTEVEKETDIGEGVFSKATFVGDGTVSALAAEYEPAGGSGPEPEDPESGVVITPVEGKDNTYTVEPTGEATDLAIKNVKEGDTLIINGADVTSLTVDNKEGVTIEVMNSAGNVNIAGAVVGWVESPEQSAFTTSADGYEFSTALDATKVNLTITAFTPDAEDGAVVEFTSFIGLTYKLMRGEELGTYSYEAASAVADSETLSLTDDEKPDGKAFYVIEVSK